ncbi:flavin reductase family protein [Halobacillus sp. Cin3]|uniref:flavin reductase family protein n=1 Tax=Halobacillus sp. Cin3 TaxID=2928441 RepID=UPI00248DB329|nr:flavin reductase family protein [Halobacillus sp. Cin3]
MKIGENQFHEHRMSKLVKGAVVPRPIAWVSSLSSDGVANLAPFSFFTVASMDPVTLCFSIGDGEREKDTLVNIRETETFIINLVTEQLADQMHESSKNHSPDVDEFHAAGVESEPGDFVNVPRVKESPVHMECTLSQVVEVGSGHLVLGRLVGYHVRDDVYMDVDKIDPYKLKPVGRMAGDYTYVREFYSLPTGRMKQKKS